MSDTERAWLVYREYTDKGLLSLVYATEDGERVFRKQRSMNAGDPTAATDADTADLEPVADDEDVHRYRDEVRRMRDRHDPDDQV